MYTQNNGTFTLYNEFKNSDKLEWFTTEIINIPFVNNNHFNLLIDKIYESKDRISTIQKEMPIKDMTENIVYINKKRDIHFSDYNKKNFAYKTYINYNRDSCINYYNEIYLFIKSNKTIYPERLIYNKTKNKKRSKFRKFVNSKYKIANNRLQYKHYNNNKDLWLYIPYQDEFKAMLKFLHYNNNHLKRD